MQKKFSSFILLFIIANTPFIAQSGTTIKISKLSPQSEYSWIIVQADGENKALKEIFTVFEKAKIMKEPNSSEGVTQYTLGLGKSSIAIATDSTYRAWQSPEDYPPQTLSLIFPQKDFEYNLNLNDANKSTIKIFNVLAINFLMQIFASSETPITALTPRGRKLSTPFLTCVENALFTDPHDSTYCTLTLNSN